MKKIKNLFIVLFTFLTVSSFSQILSYSVNYNVTTNVTCNVGDTLKFYGTVPTVFGVQINGVTTVTPHICANSPYYIGYRVVTASDNSFTILASINWNGTITVQTGTGIIENTNTSSIKIFPNPTGEILTMDGINMQNITIINYAGQVVKTQIVKANKATLNIADLPNGVYFIEILADNKKSINKIVKE